MLVYAEQRASAPGCADDLVVVRRGDDHADGGVRQRLCAVHGREVGRRMLVNGVVRAEQSATHQDAHVFCIVKSG
jgi:hypothetical protein